MRRVAVALVISVAVATGASAQPFSAPAESLDDVRAYMCPIHSDYTAERPGTCPRDGMMLIPATPFDVRDYLLEVETEPAPARAGEPLTLTFKVFHPGTGELVRDFAIVHEERYHLFVVSRDMQHFEHLHPAQRADGAWTIDVVLSRPGHYELLSDFVPQGAPGQFIVQPLVTAAHEGDLIREIPRLEPDTELSKTVGELTATLSLDPPTFVAGLYGHLEFHLTDARTSRPVTDLQPYLGAFGHTLILSEDMVEYVHSHPIDLSADLDEPRLFMLPMDADHAHHGTFYGGPDVTFDGLMPRAGRYRAFTQFLWRDELYTFAFTFVVVDEEKVGP
jgi:hypothetical protein